LIQNVLPIVFCAVPVLAGVLIIVALPGLARDYYIRQVFVQKSPMDWLILILGIVLFFFQLELTWQALQWRGNRFNERPDRWLSHLAQAAEWFPLLGLLGTVAGILQTFSSITGQVAPELIIKLYAPAITATGSGLFMALINILPTWVVVVGRELILSLGGAPAPERDDHAAERALASGPVEQR
jgi:biopolymer transport protein ExbB/TolQ